MRLRQCMALRIGNMQLHYWTIILSVYLIVRGSTVQSQTNLLLGKPTSQSSTWVSTSTSDKAVDGNTNGYYDDGSCMHTRSNTNEWWMVDIGSTQCIGKVSIYNRVDQCCRTYLVSAVIRIGSSSNRNNPECGIVTLNQVNADQKIDFTCNMRGQYLSIDLPSSLFHVCEVQAFIGECRESPRPCRQRVYNSSDAERLDKHVVHELNTHTNSECALTCSSMSNRCTSFNWNELGKTCQLNNARQSEYPSDIKTSHHWKYYDIDNNYEGKCVDSSACANNGTCELSCGNEDGFVCHCKGGFSGRLCRIPQECTTTLGMSSGDILDDQLHFSSAPNASNIRLSSTQGWSAAESDSSPWIKVEFLTSIEVSGLITKGEPVSGGWVKEYEVAYEADVQNSFKPVEYKDQFGNVKIFKANVDTDTEVMRLFDQMITTTAVTLKIVSCNGTCGLRMDILGCKSDWRLVFKAVAGIATTDTDQLKFDLFKVWERLQGYNEDVPNARQLDTTFKDHYKSSFVLDWQHRNIREVKVTLFDKTGNELISLVFNGEGSDSMNWFSKARLISSPWNDLDLETQNFFSLSGLNPRRWYINRNFGGCVGDTGWLVVSCKNADCAWENRATKPTFFYSKLKSYTTYNTDVGEADIFAIFVKTN